MTDLQKDYIDENRLNKSMIDIAGHLKIPYNRIRNYYRANDLQLTKKELAKIKEKTRGQKKAWDWDALP